MSEQSNKETKSEKDSEEIYAFLASGGFTIERGFSLIKKYESMAPEHIDVTDSIQIMLDVSKFNEKLGEFNVKTNSYEKDSITISPEDLIKGLRKGGQVFSAGKYSTLYKDFTNYVLTYFGYTGGINSLFMGASDFAIDTMNQFTGESFVKLLNGETENENGEYISNLSGSVTINGINALLRYVSETNAFGNRDEKVKKWSIEDGFVEGDLIWVPVGTTITLKVGIYTKKYKPISTENKEHSTGSDSSIATTLIKRTVSAPLLIKLVSSEKIESLPEDTNNETTSEMKTEEIMNELIEETVDIKQSLVPEPIIPVLMKNLLLLGNSVSGKSYITSPDALWTVDEEISKVKSVASNELKYYAVGEGTTTIVKSIDGGETWRVAFNSPYSKSGNDVLLLENTLITCGEGENTLAYITDISVGNTWTIVNTGLTKGNRLFYDRSANRIYVVGAGTNTISYTSSIKEIWKGLGEYVFKNEATAIHGPANYKNARIWVTVGQGGNSFAYSVNGTTFTSNGTFPMTSAAAIEYGAETFGTPVWIAGGQGANTLAFTKNPSAGWIGLGSTVLSTNCKSVAYGIDGTGQHVWIAAGTGTLNALAYSKNPVTAAGWYGLGKALMATGYCVTCGKDASGNTLWIAGGSGFSNTLVYSRNPTVASSWIGLGKSIFSTACYGIAYGTDCFGNPLWIATGQDDLGNNNAIAYSRDPTEVSSWVGLGSNALSVGQGIAYGTDGTGNPIWLAVGSGVNNVVYSRNPIDTNSWTGINTGFASSSGASVSYGVDANGNALWIVGQLTTNTIIYSNYPTMDGTWTKPDANVFSITGAGFAQERLPKYISCGKGIDNLMGSIDGLTWYIIKSPFSEGTNDIYWSQEQQIWVAVGEGTNTVAYSNNGISWTGLGTSIFTVRGNRVVYSEIENKWYIVGEGMNVMATSNNGKEWNTYKSIAEYEK